MESSVFAISPDALVRLLIFLLYASVVLISYRYLIPRLSPTSKRLATGMLAALVLAIVMSLVFQSKSRLEGWLWNLDREFNISTTLASTQLALVSAVALVTAWLARTRPFWHRLYLAGIALVFLYLAREEFYEMRRIMFGTQWPIYYIALGTAVIAATLAVAARSPRHTWIWHICLLAGLAVSSAGAIGVEELRYEEICRSLGLLSGRGCQAYQIEESLEFLGIWLTLIAVLGQFSDAAPRPRPLVRRILYLLPMFLFIHLLLPNSYLQPVHLEYQFLAQPLSVEYESDVGLLGYRTNREEGALVIQFFASTASWHDYTGLGYSVHLVDQVTGGSIAGLDASASRRDQGRINLNVHGKRYLWMYKQRIAVQFPAKTPTNRALWVVITTWREEDDAFVSQKIISSDHQLLGDTQVVLGELVLPAEPARSTTVPFAEFDNEFSLENVDLPEGGQAGMNLQIPFAWRTDKDAHEDYVQFLHFVHKESGVQWGHDQQPLGPRLPTRLWYSGLADTEVWQVPLPADLAPGRYEVFTGLYRATDMERLPASDADGTSFIDARVALGALTIDGA